MLLGVQAELSVIVLDLNLVIFLTLDVLSILLGSLANNMILCFNMTELLLTCSHPVIFFCFARYWAWHMD